uniref:HSF-type DNA-binding domain-containing protein n=1 Tax=Skeletonema marinoi TaxID=267567 RepID=A0A7S2PFK8_9STRA|mmetsp:Transcript_20120/g.34080  ORF Transcript_20120/g.34080 Transcript_20120/m.34080 type:complete len:315 (+) Transcript_20120:83-1027(+)
MCTRKAIPRRVTFETPSKSVAGMQEQQQFQQQQTFPFKLYNMLEYACDSEFGSCISWTADGSEFIIHDKEAMMDNLAPMFFNQTKFRSFTRQLNIWGFVRTDTLDGWRHNNFLRGRPHLLNEIERTQVKSTVKAEALAQQALNLNAADSAKNVAVAANETSSRVDAQAQAQSFQSSNEDNSAHIGIAVAVSQFPFAQAPAQGQGSVFSYLFQDSTSLLPPSVQRYSSDETINQAARTRTEQAGAIDRYTFDAYTTSASASTSTSGAAVQPFDYSNVAAQPFFDHDELMYLASIFDEDEHKSQEDDLCSILSLDR